MTITTHTGVTRGLNVTSHLTPLVHTGITRTSGGGATPLEDAVDAEFTALIVGDYHKQYDFTTLSSDSSGAPRDITSHGDDVGFIAGNRTTGSVVDCIQAGAARKVQASTTYGTSQGLVGSGNQDRLEGAIASQGQPVTMGFRLTTAGVLDVDYHYFLGLANAGNTAYALIYMDNKVYKIYTGTAISGSTLAASTTYYGLVIFDSASSAAELDGVVDITGNSGAHTGFTSILMCGLRIGGTHAEDIQLEKSIVYSGAASAGTQAVFNAWLAVEGDA